LADGVRRIVGTGGRAVAGAASPMIAAASPLTTVAANPNLFIKTTFFLAVLEFCIKLWLVNRQPSALIPLAEIDRRLAEFDNSGQER
jgi:hypothetical protein